VAALGLGLCLTPGARAAVHHLRLLDHVAVLDQLPDVLPCNRRDERRCGARAAGGSQASVRLPHRVRWSLLLPRAPLLRCLLLSLLQAVSRPPYACSMAPTVDCVTAATTQLPMPAMGQSGARPAAAKLSPETAAGLP
jgi:hypothetical protein